MNLFEVEIRPKVKQVKLASTQSEIIARRRAASAREHAQWKLWQSEVVHKESVLAKLLRAGAREHCARTEESWLANFERCEKEEHVLMCELCRRVRTVCYRCSLKWCPCCNWRVSLKRRRLMEKMTFNMRGVKHVVLTQRNFKTNLREKIRESRKNLARLRRQKFFGVVTGGCASLEFTNEGKGWHLHWHLLVQSQFLPARELSLAWGALVGQEFAIVKVMDVTDRSYLQELCKYVVSGAELAGWKPSEILEFVVAMQGTRCFGSFGKFREIQKFARAVLETEKPCAPACECGCDSMVFAESPEMAARIIEKWQRRF